MTRYTAGRQNRRLEFTDTNELTVEWPNELAPTTHAEAAAEALRAIPTQADLMVAWPDDTRDTPTRGGLD